MSAREESRQDPGGPRNGSGGPRPSIGGITLVVVLVLGVAVWMSLQRPQPESAGDMERLSGLTASLGDLSGFRSNAWFLPDEGLLGFVEVPAGPFSMGSDPAIDPLAFDNEWWPGARPQATVDLPAFYIGRYEVTVAQFAAFVEETGYRANDEAFQTPPDHPVATVSWTDALAYARWLETALRGMAGDAPGAQPTAPRRLANQPSDRSSMGEGGARVRREGLSMGE